MSKGQQSQKESCPAAIRQTPEQVIAAKRRRLANRETVTSFFLRLIAFALLLWVLFGLVFGITPMRNDDMSPRLSAGDLMLYYRLDNTWHTQDVIVFEKDGVQYTARIVAQAGDTVEITSGSSLKVNNSVVLENNIYYKTPRYDDRVTYPVQLKENQFFVLCDYREGAKDSRYFGPVDRSEIKGKVITVIRRSGL
jgi:signal peptidase I, bacterial type